MATRLTHRAAFVILLASALFSSACQNRSITRRETGALAGGALGAGLGAIIGNQTGNSGAGIAIGSAIGALSGALVGNELQNENDQLDQRDQQISAQERELEENRRLIEQLKRGGADAYGSSRGVVVNLPDVLFDFGSAKLTSEARATTRDIADAISSVPDRTISVEGHTDSVGSAEYNQRLSESRARAVAGELESAGVSRRNIRTKGMGESDPVATNNTQAGRDRNRRVEVIIENSRR